MQPEEDISLQKLAVLVSHLSPDAASALIAELPPTIAGLVQDHAACIGSIDAVERDAILREFREHCEQQESSASVWDELPASQIAAALERERPCVVAAMLPQVSESKAAQILSGLPNELKQQALQLIPKQSLNESTSAAFQNALKQQVAALEAEQFASRQMNSIARLANEELAAIEAMKDQRHNPHPFIREGQGTFELSDSPPQAIVDPPIVVAPSLVHRRSHQVEVQSPQQQLQPTQATMALSPATFESIADLPPSVIEAVLQELPGETVLIAIAGATPHFASRLKQLIHPDDWNQLHAGISQLGAMRLEDIDYAQSIVLKAAQDVVRDQELEASPTALRRAG